MPTNLKNDQATTLERIRIALENSSQDPIAKAMAELGYDRETLSEGKTLYQKTLQAYNSNRKEDDETNEAFAHFDQIKNQLDELHNGHRKKALMVFRKEPLIADRLAISGRKQRSYIPWIQSVQKFYEEVSNSEDIQQKLARLKVTPRK